MVGTVLSSLVKSKGPTLVAMLGHDLPRMLARAQKTGPQISRGPLLPEVFRAPLGSTLRETSSGGKPCEYMEKVLLLVQWVS